MNCSAWCKCGTKEKIWVLGRYWTYDLPNTGQVLYPLRYKNSWRAWSYDWVLTCMWQVSCILLGSACQSHHESYKQIKWWILSLLMKMWKVNWSAWHECGTKEKSESPTGIEPMTPWNTRWVLYPLSYENSWRARSFNWVHVCKI